MVKYLLYWKPAYVCRHEPKLASKRLLRSLQRVVVLPKEAQLPPGKGVAVAVLWQYRWSCRLIPSVTTRFWNRQRSSQDDQMQ